MAQLGSDVKLALSEKVKDSKEKLSTVHDTNGTGNSSSSIYPHSETHKKSAVVEEPVSREGSVIGDTGSGFGSANSSLYLTANSSLAGSTRSSLYIRTATPESEAPSETLLQTGDGNATSSFKSHPMPPSPFSQDNYEKLRNEQWLADEYNRQINARNKAIHAAERKAAIQYWSSLIFFAITGIDLRPKPKLSPEEEKKEKATEFSLPLKIFSYFTSVVVAIASGMITAVAVAALHIPATLIVLIGLAGYRVNLLVYKSAVDYLLGCFRDFGHGLNYGFKETFKQNSAIHLTKRIGLALLNGFKLGFTKGFFQDPSSPTGEMSRTKKILTGIGIFLSFAGGGSLAAMTFTSATSALVHIFAVIGFASLGAFPPALAGAMAIIAFVAMAALMYKSIHIAIKENAHIKLLEFIKGLKHSNDPKVENYANTTPEIIKHYVVSACKLLFIAAGVALAVVATVATLGAWQHSMVTMLTGIPGAYAKACEVASYILVFGLTAAGRIPMVIDKAASVFSAIGGWVGNTLYTVGEKTAGLFGYKPQYQQLVDNKKAHQKSLWEKIKGECTDSQTNKFSVNNTLIFAGKTTAQVLAIGLVIGIVVGSILLNAGGNGAVADEGASFLNKILNFFHIYPSNDIQSGMPFFTGGMVSLILGLDGARTTYLPAEKENTSEPQEIEMQNVAELSRKDSATKTLNALTAPQTDPCASPTTSAAQNKQAPTKVKYVDVVTPSNPPQTTDESSSAKLDNSTPGKTAKRQGKNGSIIPAWLRTIFNPEDSTKTADIEKTNLLPNHSAPTVKYTLRT